MAQAATGRCTPGSTVTTPAIGAEGPAGELQRST